MNDHTQAAPTEPTLKDAMRRLRIEEAERTGVIVALRDAEFARLSILHERLKPILAAVPAGIDLFDTGLTPGETPRLWIDMIAFVEMGRDKRSYRFLQDTRNGRRVLGESDDVTTMADRITAYIAQRLIERERMMALPPAVAVADVAHVRAESALPRAAMPVALMPAAAAPAEVPPSAPRVQEPEPANDSHGPAEPDAFAPAEPPVRSRGVKFSGLGGFVLFLLGVAAGVGGLLAVAQIASRL